MLIKKSVLFFIFLFLSISTYFTIDSLKQKQISLTEDIIFKEHLGYMTNDFDSLYNKFRTDSIYSSKQLIETLDIAAYLAKPYKDFSYYNSDETYLKIYDLKGDLLFSNENRLNGEKNNDFLLKHLLKNPLFNNTLLTSRRGLTLSHFFPVYKNELLGVARIDYQLDKLTEKLDKENIKTFIVLNSSFSSVVDVNMSYSRNFIGSRYVVNKNSDKYYQKILEQSGFIQKEQKTLINKKDGILMAKQPLMVNNKTVIGEIYLIKSIETIDLSLISFIKSFFDVINLLMTIIYALILYFIYNTNKNKRFAIDNERLLKENMKLNILSDKLDYNEKKLSNLFNLQPNIMFISNGVDIVQVNKRFMGFFRRYKSFENFKQNHKDISELFEACDRPNYIASELIEGKYWLEYILENPKRLYKTVMSVDNEQHHFIIKVNEMDYVRNFQERYIVVAFVDITQDIVQKDEKKTQINTADPLDITYLIENNISSTIKEFINILPTKQAIFKGDENELYELKTIRIEARFTKKDQQLKWDFYLPVTTVSFITNHLTSNYDDGVNNNIDEESIKTASSIINSLSSHICSGLDREKHESLSGLGVTIAKEEALGQENDHKPKNLYKFVMFAEDQELSVYIDFDDESMRYLNQIYMLGMFFNS